jgi:BirA family biotin operon repressor/biotin-[acetyl-CoA-carboxylase] ligase
MEDARRLFSAGCTSGTVVLAGFQQRGRGRIAERSWSSPPGKNLLFTLVLRTERGEGGMAAAPQRFPLVAGLALALSVEQLFGLPARLKWPNDLLVEGRKLAGILCEAMAESNSLGILVGVGLNCNQIDFPPELKRKAVSLALILGREVNLLEVLETALANLHLSLEDHDWRAKVASRLCGMNQAVYLYSTPQPGRERGVILGLNPDGSLRFKADSSTEVVSIYSGEISLTSEEA